MLMLPFRRWGRRYDEIWLWNTPDTTDTTSDLIINFNVVDADEEGNVDINSITDYNMRE